MKWRIHRWLHPNHTLDKAKELWGTDFYIWYCSCGKSFKVEVKS